MSNEMKLINQQEQPQQLQQVTAFSSPEGFEAAQRMARALTSSTMVPERYRGADNMGNAIIALEMAQRMSASPLMVMQNLYMVHGNPGWSSKFLIATFNHCGKFTAIRYEWKGTAGKTDRACRAYAIEKSTGERVEGPVIDWGLVNAEGWASKSGSKWKTMPEKMFAYRAAAWMIDTVAPELSMGLPAADNLEDIIDLDDSQYKVINTSTGEISGNQQKPSEETGPGSKGVLSDNEFMGFHDTLKNKIESGEMTHSEVIGFIANQGYQLTAEQEKTINSFTVQSVEN